MSSAVPPAMLQIAGWRVGFQKVAHTKALQKFAGLSLSQAKAATDAVLVGETVQLYFPTAADAERLAAHLESLGAIACVERTFRSET